MDFFLDFISQTMVNRYSLLYRIEGIEDTANPYMLCGHYDVVPPGTDWDSDWPVTWGGVNHTAAK